LPTFAELGLQRLDQGTRLPPQVGVHGTKLVSNLDQQPDHLGGGILVVIFHTSRAQRSRISH